MHKQFSCDPSSSTVKKGGLVFLVPRAVSLQCVSVCVCVYGGGICHPRQPAPESAGQVSMAWGHVLTWTKARGGSLHHAVWSFL